MSVGSTRRRLQGDSGAMLVEFAFVLPLLVTMGLGIAEFGFEWRDTMTVTTSVRNAARQGTAARNADSADFTTVTAALAGLGAISASQVNKVIVYKSPQTVNGATATAQPPPAACTTTAAMTAGGVPGVCNVYSGTELTALPSSMTGIWAGTCGSSPSRPDSNWCPQTRNATISSSVVPDVLGVYMSINHKTITGLFGSSTKVISEYAVFDVEPEAS